VVAVYTHSPGTIFKAAEKSTVALFVKPVLYRKFNRCQQPMLSNFYFFRV